MTAYCWSCLLDDVVGRILSVRSRGRVVAEKVRQPRSGSSQSVSSMGTDTNRVACLQPEKGYLPLCLLVRARSKAVCPGLGTITELADGQRTRSAPTATSSGTVRLRPIRKRCPAAPSAESPITASTRTRSSKMMEGGVPCPASARLLSRSATPARQRSRGEYGSTELLNVPDPDVRTISSALSRCR